MKTHRNVKSNGTFQNESASLVICFSLLRNESTNSFDVHFITKENTIIGAHSLIVGSRSSVLSKLVFSNRLNSPCCISVYRFSSKIVEHVCVWMYSDLFLQNLPTEEIDSIIELCKEWNLMSAIEFLSSMQFRIDFEINLEDGITATESFLEKICDEADHVLRNHPNNNNNTNNNNVLF